MIRLVTQGKEYGEIAIIMGSSWIAKKVKSQMKKTRGRVDKIRGKGFDKIKNNFLLADILGLIRH